MRDQASLCKPQALAASISERSTLGAGRSELPLWQLLLEPLLHSYYTTPAQPRPRPIEGRLLNFILAHALNEIKQALSDWEWPSIRRRVVAGMPEWNKEELLKRQFA